MQYLEVPEVTARLDGLIEAIARGQEDEVVIVRGGRPVARLVVLSTCQVGVRIGVAEGEFRMPSTDDTSDVKVAGPCLDAAGAQADGSKVVLADAASGRRPGRLVARLDDSFFDELPPDELAAWERPTK